MNTQDFWRLYRQIYRRRWLVLTVFGTTLVVVGLGCIFMPRYYRAAAYVMPSEAALSKPVIPGAGAAPSGMGEVRSDVRGRKEELMATFTGLAQTAEVKQRAIKSTGLAATPAELDDLVKVEPAWGSIIRITCLARTADGAIALANAIAHEFSNYYRDQTSFQATRNRQFLEQELAVSQAEDNRLKVDLQAFKGQHGEAALPVGLAENPFLSQFYSLRSDMDLTKSQLRSAEGRLQAVQAELKKQLPDTEVNISTTDNPVTTQLQDELARLERDLLLARAKYTEKHRRVQDLHTQIADVRERLSRESDRLISRRTIGPNPVYGDLKQQLVQLSTERTALSARLNALAEAMAENERKAAELADSSVVLMAKTRDYETAQTRLAVLKQMMDQARVDEKVSSSAGEIQVIDKAQSAVGPVTRSGPSPFQLLLLGFVLSIALGLGTALALAFLDDRVQDREDLSRELSLPVLAVIPQLTDGDADLPAARITDMRPLSPYAEAFRFLRAELTRAGGGKAVKSFLVATARPNQGGSTTAANLAIALAEVGHRVVLVDADMRRPRLHSFFGEDNEAGLTTLLADGHYGAQRALRRTTMENLALLPAGPEVPNPAALLSSERMRRLIAELEAHCDYVVIDTPSAAAFADATLLGSLVDGVVLVFRANQPVRAVERRTKELFEKVGAKVLGVVLNGAPGMSVDSYYFHRHYYPGPPELALESESVAAEEGAQEPSARSAGFAASATMARGEPTPAETPMDTSAHTPRPARRPLLVLLREHPRFGLFVVAAVTVVLLAVGYTGLRATGHAGRATVGPAASRAPVAVVPGVTVTAVVAARTMVRIERDGELLYDGPVAAGQQIWQGGSDVTVWVEHPEAISISVNGRELGVMGTPGAGSVSRRFTAADGAPDKGRTSDPPTTAQ